MSAVTIEESGMVFGAYPENLCFHIEKSPSILNTKQGEGVKTAEFLLLQVKQNKASVVAIIEAKQTAPKLAENQTKFDSDIELAKQALINAEFDISVFDKIQKALAKANRDSYFDDIKEKYSNTLALFVSFHLQRYPIGHAELSDSFKKLTLANVNFKLILVIKESDTAH